VLTNHKERDGKDGALWSPASYAAELPNPAKGRCNVNVDAICALVIDIDDGTPPSALTPGWDRWAYAIHSSFSSTPGHPKWRAVFPLARPVPSAEWPRVHRRLVVALAGGHTDPSCKDASRMYYFPSHPPGATPFVDAHDGEWLELDAFSDPPEEPKRPAFGDNGRHGARPEGQGDYSTLDVVAWFQARNSYGRHLGGAKHAVACPWKSEHTQETSAKDSDTVVWEAQSGGWPQFHCSHAHCDGRRIASVMEAWRDADQFCSAMFQPANWPPAASQQEAPPERKSRTAAAAPERSQSAPPEVALPEEPAWSPKRLITPNEEEEAARATWLDDYIGYAESRLSAASMTSRARS
jgi:hypothetical protein